MGDYTALRSGLTRVSQWLNSQSSITASRSGPWLFRFGHICKSEGEALSMKSSSVLRSAVLVAVLLPALACGPSESTKKRVETVYDQKTGKLQELKWDETGDGKTDRWAYMDGSRVVRVEIDDNADGKVDRWEYYSADRKIEKVGFSRAKDGVEDAWAYNGPDGQLARIETVSYTHLTLPTILLV